MSTLFGSIGLYVPHFCLASNI
uniref:Uncharacterized protein n=1 Tax=Arundo donax TaxID=35708 RepID=A0A0A8XZ80_ARUDO